ncbi:homeodomain-interacting protein kinase 1-like isoform 1-T1 [Synchiropus picturatus]
MELARKRRGQGLKTEVKGARMATCCKVGRMFYSPSSAYVVEKVLGRGNFGEVTQCKNLLTVETVAVKQTRDSSYIEQAMEEAEILRTLKECNSDKYNIVRWNDAFTWEGCYCLEFEKLDVTLLEYMQKTDSGALQLQEIRPILQQLATALKFLQSLKIVHGDLKPENIMLVDEQRKPPRVKVIDFGLAIPISEVYLGQIFQTLWYRCSFGGTCRAPEILLGAPFNEIIDVWSLGCIAVEMLVGQTLFPAQDEFEMMRRISHTLESPPNYMLMSALRSAEYFELDITGRWTSKTPPETNGCDSHVINSLHDLLVIVPFDKSTGKEIGAELNDRVRFIELIGKMLKIEPEKRITAGQILQDPFVTMSHLHWMFVDTSYFESCVDFMESSDGPASPEPTSEGQPSRVSRMDPPMSRRSEPKPDGSNTVDRPAPDNTDPGPRKKRKKHNSSRSLKNNVKKNRSKVKCGSTLEPSLKQADLADDVHQCVSHHDLGLHSFVPVSIIKKL